MMLVEATPPPAWRGSLHVEIHDNVHTVIARGLIGESREKARTVEVLISMTRHVIDARRANARWLDEVIRIAAEQFEKLADGG